MSADNTTGNATAIGLQETDTASSATPTDTVTLHQPLELKPHPLSPAAAPSSSPASPPKTSTHPALATVKPHLLHPFSPQESAANFSPSPSPLGSTFPYSRYHENTHASPCMGSGLGGIGSPQLTGIRPGPLGFHYHAGPSIHLLRRQSSSLGDLTPSSVSRSGSLAVTPFILSEEATAAVIEQQMRRFAEMAAARGSMPTTPRQRAGEAVEEVHAWPADFQEQLNAAKAISPAGALSATPGTAFATPEGALGALMATLAPAPERTYVDHTKGEPMQHQLAATAQPPASSMTPGVGPGSCPEADTLVSVASLSTGAMSTEDATAESAGANEPSQTGEGAGGGVGIGRTHADTGTHAGAPVKDVVDEVSSSAGSEAEGEEVAEDEFGIPVLDLPVVSTQVCVACMSADWTVWSACRSWTRKPACLACLRTPCHRQRLWSSAVLLLLSPTHHVLGFCCIMCMVSVRKMTACLQMSVCLSGQQVEEEPVDQEEAKQVEALMAKKHLLQRPRSVVVPPPVSWS